MMRGFRRTDRYNKEFVAQILYPSVKFDSIKSNAFLVGWNLENFRCCIACVVELPSSSFHSLQNAVQTSRLALRNVLHHCDASGTGMPSVLGEYRSSIPADYVPPNEFQSAGIWIVLTKSSGHTNSIQKNPHLRCLYSLGCQYNTICEMVEYTAINTDALQCLHVSDNSIVENSADDETLIFKDKSRKISKHSNSINTRVYTSEFERITAQINASHDLFTAIRYCLDKLENEPTITTSSIGSTDGLGCFNFTGPFKWCKKCWRRLVMMGHSVAGTAFLKLSLCAEAMLFWLLASVAWIWWFLLHLLKSVLEHKFVLVYSLGQAAAYWLEVNDLEDFQTGGAIDSNQRLNGLGSASKEHAAAQYTLNTFHASSTNTNAAKHTDPIRSSFRHEHPANLTARPRHFSNTGKQSLKQNFVEENQDENKKLKGVMPHRRGFFGSNTAFSVCDFSVTAAHLSTRCTQLDGVLRRCALFPHTWARAPASLKQKLWMDVISFVCMSTVDIVLGLCFTVLLLRNLHQFLSWLCTAARWAHNELILAGLRWLDHTPGGIKLNHHVTEKLQKLLSFLVRSYTLVLWKILVPSLPLVVRVLALSGCAGGATTLCAISIDILRICTAHITALHKVLAYQHQYELELIYSMYLLFRGKKKNVLRGRIDTYASFDQHQLLFGILIFSIAAFLFPSFAVYFLLFAVAQLAVTMMQSLLWGICVGIKDFPYYHAVLYFVDKRFLTDDVELSILSTSKSVITNSQKAKASSQHPLVSNTKSAWSVLSFLSADMFGSNSLSDSLSNTANVLADTTMTSNFHGVVDNIGSSIRNYPSSVVHKINPNKKSDTRQGETPQPIVQPEGQSPLRSILKHSNESHSPISNYDSTENFVFDQNSKKPATDMIKSSKCNEQESLHHEAKKDFSITSPGTDIIKSAVVHGTEEPIPVFTTQPCTSSDLHVRFEGNGSHSSVLNNNRDTDQEQHHNTDNHSDRSVEVSKHLEVSNDSRSWRATNDTRTVSPTNSPCFDRISCTDSIHDDNDETMNLKNNSNDMLLVREKICLGGVMMHDEENIQASHIGDEETYNVPPHALQQSNGFESNRNHTLIKNISEIDSDDVENNSFLHHQDNEPTSPHRNAYKNTSFRTPLYYSSGEFTIMEDPKTTDDEFSASKQLRGDRPLPYNLHNTNNRAFDSFTTNKNETGISDRTAQGYSRIAADGFRALSGGRIRGYTTLNPTMAITSGFSAPVPTSKAVYMRLEARSALRWSSGAAAFLGVFNSIFSGDGGSINAPDNIISHSRKTITSAGSSATAREKNIPDNNIASRKRHPLDRDASTNNKNSVEGLLLRLFRGLCFGTPSLDLQMLHVTTSMQHQHDKEDKLLRSREVQVVEYELHTALQNEHSCDRRSQSVATSIEQQNNLIPNHTKDGFPSRDFAVNNHGTPISQNLPADYTPVKSKVEVERHHSLWCGTPSPSAIKFAELSFFEAVCVARITPTQYIKDINEISQHNFASSTISGTIPMNNSISAQNIDNNNMEESIKSVWRAVSTSPSQRWRSRTLLWTLLLLMALSAVLSLSAFTYLISDFAYNHSQYIPNYGSSFTASSIAATLYNHDRGVVSFSVDNNNVKFLSPFAKKNSSIISSSNSNDSSAAKSTYPSPLIHQHGMVGSSVPSVVVKRVQMKNSAAFASASSSTENSTYYGNNLGDAFHSRNPIHAVEPNRHRYYHHNNSLISNLIADTNFSLDAGRDFVSNSKRNVDRWRHQQQYRGIRSRRKRPSMGIRKSTVNHYQATDEHLKKLPIIFDPMEEK